MCGEGPSPAVWYPCCSRHACASQEPFRPLERGRYIGDFPGRFSWRDAQANSSCSRISRTAPVARSAESLKVLFDHCVPRRFRRLLIGHEVCTAFEMGWAGLSNRALLAEASREFGAFLTVDQNVQFQQNLATLP